MLDIGPRVVPKLPGEEQALAARRETGFGEYMGAMASEGWWNTLAGQARAQVRQAKGKEADPRRLSRDEWQASAWQREGLDWYEGLTAGQAKVRAEVFDENAYRRWVIGQRDAGVIGMAAGIGAMLVGSLPTPENLIPIGPAYHAAKVARFGLAMRRGAVVGGLAGLAGTAAFAPPVYYSASQFGDDIGWADVMLDLSLGTALGAGLGAGSAAMHHWATRSSRQPTMNTPQTQTALDAMGLAGQDIAAGRPVDVAASPDVRAAIRDAAVQHASPGVRVNVETARRASAGVDRIVAEENARMDRDAAVMREADRSATRGSDPARPANENVTPSAEGIKSTAGDLGNGADAEAVLNGEPAAVLTNPEDGRQAAGASDARTPEGYRSYAIDRTVAAHEERIAEIEAAMKRGAVDRHGNLDGTNLQAGEVASEIASARSAIDEQVKAVRALSDDDIVDSPGYREWASVAASDRAARERASGSEYASRSPADPDLEPLAPLAANDDAALEALDQETFDRFVAELEERGDIPDDIRAEIEEAAEFERRAATAREVHERAAYCALGG